MDNSVFKLTSNNVQVTWDDLRVALEEYYGEVSDSNARIVVLANIKQGRTEGIQGYTIVVRLAESEYKEADRENQVVTK